ncbi:MAG: DUF4153 domain-containing protein [Saprospiraceae bacterium]|nr:DUF4153 domain-containing protein [Saprospiraceae bacterium]MDW8229280.1 DUF4153 domain-containing protein [Saprospiraceae bacterium]
MGFSLRLPLFSISLWLRAFAEACARFPAAMVCAAAFTGALIQLIALEVENTDSTKLAMAALLGLPLSIGFAALAERIGWEGWKNYALQSLGLLAAAVCFLLLYPKHPSWEGVQVPRYFLVLVAAHLWTSVSPFLSRRGVVADFWEYNKRLLTHFVVGVVYAAILFLGLALAIAAVNALFDLKWTGRVYGYLFAVVAGLFQTTFFLYHFPKRMTFDDDEVGYPVLLKNLCQYVFVPIVGLYFLILYAYSAKILLEWNLPRGWVSSLVLGFSVAGIFTYLISYRLPEFPVSRWVPLYQRFFWWVLAPMIVLLFIAISRRISDYGVTPERYFVAHTGVWLLVACVYFLWSKADDIRFIPVSLALFIVPAIVGPFSAFEVSQRSQVGILKEILEKNQAFESSGLLKKNLSTLPDEDRERLRSILYFLSEQGALERISSWLSEPIATIAPDSLFPFERTQRVLEHLGLERQGSYETLYLTAEDPKQTPVSVSIAGFRTFYAINLVASSPPETKTLLSVRLSSSGKEMVVRLNGAQTVADTLEFGQRLLQWETEGRKREGRMPDSLSTLDWVRGPRTYRLFVHEVWMEDRTRRVQQLKGALFVK